MPNIPFLDLEGQHHPIRGEITKAINDVVARNRFVMDKYLTDFEKNYASYIGASWCCGVGNGLDAIFLSLRALGIRAEDEVIVPTNTAIATWLGVRMPGRK